MDKSDFKEFAEYQVTMRDENGKMRPANIYVYRLYDDFMIARRTNQTGLLCKIAYDDVVRIVRTLKTEDKPRFMLPEAVLAKKNWEDRTCMQAYASSPALGK